MKYVSRFLLVSSLSLIAFSSEGSLFANSSDESKSPTESTDSLDATDAIDSIDAGDVIDVPARAHHPLKMSEVSDQVSAPSDRINRKPAIEARVYVEDPSKPSSNPSGLYYYDYKDQRPEQGQNPPLQPPTF